MSIWNGHYQCTCYHPLFVFNQFGDLERCVLRPGNVHSADGWDDLLKPVVARYHCKLSRIYFRTDAALPTPMSTGTSKPSASNMRSAFQPTRFSRTMASPLRQANSVRPSGRRFFGITEVYVELSCALGKGQLRLHFPAAHVLSSA